MRAAGAPLPGAVPSPNIWQHPEVYETENRALDPERRVEAAIRTVRPWLDGDVLDVGCGTGYHLPRWAEQARSVTGVEPHPGLARIAVRRTARLPNVAVLAGTAQRLPVADASVDVAVARWAYFFGPGCEPGLTELARVMRRGGAAFVVDTDPTRSTFGRWFRRGYPDVDPDAVARFWSQHGWQRTAVDVRWRFERRADLEAVLAIELPDPVARDAVAEHEGLEVDCALNLWWRRF